MASTRRPVEAINTAREYVKGMPIDTVAVEIANDVLSAIWMAAPWRWTVGSMIFQMTAGTGDYVVPTEHLSILYILSAGIWDGDSWIDLAPEPVLPSQLIVGVPSRVALARGNNNELMVRVRPAYGSLGKTSYMTVWYKKPAPVLTAETMHTPGALVMDDEWFWVFRDGVLWRAYQYADDMRAGSVQVSSNGVIQYTGQRGVFESGLELMRAAEPLPVPFARRAAEDRKRTRG